MDRDKNNVFGVRTSEDKVMHIKKENEKNIGIMQNKHRGLSATAYEAQWKKIVDFFVEFKIYIAINNYPL